MNIINKGQKIFKKVGYDKLIIIILAGIMLVILSVPQKSKEYELKTSSSYEENLEKKLTDTLSKIKGVGKVNVIIKAENSQKAFLSNNDYPKIDGIIIIAEGGDDIEVKEKLTKGIEALLGLSAHKICILKME